MLVRVYRFFYQNKYKYERNRTLHFDRCFWTAHHYIGVVWSQNTVGHTQTKEGYEGTPTVLSRKQTTQPVQAIARYIIDRRHRKTKTVIV